MGVFTSVYYSMGVPVWARSNNSGHENNSSHKIQPSTSSNRFPVHRLEDSPVIAVYTGTTHSSRPRSKSINPGQECPPPRPPSPHSRPCTPGRSQTPVNPGEIVWEVRKEYFSSEQQQSSVDLVPVPAVIHEAGLHDFPSNTKKVAENQGLWYKQFARNMGGLLQDKPYKNLQWPPPAS